MMNKYIVSYDSSDGEDYSTTTVAQVEGGVTKVLGVFYEKPLSPQEIRKLKSGTLVVVSWKGTSPKDPCRIQNKGDGQVHIVRILMGPDGEVPVVSDIDPESDKVWLVTHHNHP